jgi:hypothetical protein
MMEAEHEWRMLTLAQYDTLAHLLSGEYLKEAATNTLKRLLRIP